MRYGTFNAISKETKINGKNVSKEASKIGSVVSSAATSVGKCAVTAFAKN